MFQTGNIYMSHLSHENASLYKKVALHCSLNVE